MGRAGGGHSSGGHSHSSGHSFSSGSRSGGHRVGSSSHRAGSSSHRAGSSSYGSSSYGRSHTTIHNHYGGYGYGGYGGYYRRGYRSVGSILSSVITITFLLCMVLVFIAVISNKNSVSNNIVRTKISNGNAFMNDCVIDEIGWFDNVSRAEARLKDFWQETGVQPYIILKSYDSSLKTDNDKERWASDYYDKNFSRQDIMMFVYFAEYDTDNDVGYMTYTVGHESSAVMDSQAIEIFWNYIDKYWYSDKSTDDVMVLAFTDTGKAIMHISTNAWDVVKWLIIGVIIIGTLVALLMILKEKNRRAKEKAEEDIKILNSKTEPIKGSNPEDKYL